MGSLDSLRDVSSMLGDIQAFGRVVYIFTAEGTAYLGSGHEFTTFGIALPSFQLAFKRIPLHTLPQQCNNTKRQKAHPPFPFALAVCGYTHARPAHAINPPA